MERRSMITDDETDIVLETPAAEADIASIAEPRGLPFSFAKRHGVLIREMSSEGADAVYRAGASPLSIAEVRRFLGVPLQLTRVSPDIFDSLLQASYEQGGQKAMEMVGGLDEEFDLTQVAQELEPSDLLESNDDAPIIRFINAVLTEAIKENASDVHIEPYENRLGVRFRVDGVLHDVLHTRRALAPLVVSRIKVMSKLDIAEKRLPQDGRISLR
ncbi:MAG TPA: ATPase, T2SS/T4P/T4SS family, partial [Woeseiaceae bacterium]|nr:ATPase, T2SS/T4P/T4SS family [Woeseiaceae bacterium]